MSHNYFLLAAVLAIALSGRAVLAQEPAAPKPQPDYELLTAISRCSDVKCLDAYRQRVGARKLARIVFYEKWILLEPSRIAGEGLLHNMPESIEEQAEMMTLADWRDASKSKVESLAEIYESWPRSVADAAIALPQFLPEYIRYGLLAPNDIHSDYTGNEERVCRSDRTQFLNAFYRLDRKTQAQLRKSVFNPEKCHAVFVTDSE